MPIQTLVKRIAQARGKKKLEQLLREARDRRQLQRNEIRITGTVDELERAVQAAIIDGHITEEAIKALADEVEENGGQHIFLYRVTSAGRRALTIERFAGEYNEVPGGLTARVYGDHPPRQTYLSRRNDGIVVKQMYTAEYWEKDEEASLAESTDTRQVIVKELQRRRALNLFRIDPDGGFAEIRIGRIRIQDDENLVVEELQKFKRQLSRVLDFEQHVQPLRIRNGFLRIVRNRDRTFMAVDRAEDPSVHQTISSRRQGATGTDVRDHQTYQMADDRYVRDSVSIYWEVEAENRIHTLISVLDVEHADSITEHVKVYVGAKITPDELHHVLDRIREFTN